MTARREPSAPPTLPGYRYVRLLGLGGFADVFLYRQDLPVRDVAVKVLLAGSLDDDVRERFQTEANLMAQLSHHPSIVTIHQAAIAADGRPYLVMEYCSRPGLAQRYRTEHVSVHEALRIGIRLASAVEAAHSVGILHRDIKPANVLTTDFGWPALTDFGIAATVGQGGGATVGMSIPWSPPELLAEHPTGDERSDVYSLAATIYSLLAGRTPFEVPGGSNSAQDLVTRIERTPLPQLGRQDVPPALFAVLERAMAKHPSRRYASAQAVARALQQVEADLGLPVTPLDLPDVPLAPDDVRQPAQSDDATRLRPVIEVAPSTPTWAAVPEAPTSDGLPVLDVPAEEPDEEPSSGRGRTVTAIVSGVVVLAAVIGVAAAAMNRDDGPNPQPSQEFSVPGDAVVGQDVPSPTGLSGTRQSDGTFVFTWTNPQPAEGDRYLWGVLSATGDPELAFVPTTSVAVPPTGDDGQVCIQVTIVRADGRSSDEPTKACAS
ncbi:serine/threonine-protein kinase [Cellulomonas edaphi]|uniref:non-specific serine/threonine protein kinase n=1 Tax=Cellulomonas edaphi TaxID=3053468 RepID=A0ABT7S7F7_9CELL|nr:serine/threonine-protein kinase [Cellulomons edaphi]MDM7831542.1 serine/threonine-protein kinase [Cellulomons edaphi]